jgi:serine phosphatase RsbU (regulator of sigma subunit)/tetratricopeptide (TPR) repeat protein
MILRIMKKRRIYFAGFLLVAVLVALPSLFVAQDQIGALRRRLQEADNDTLRIAYLNQIAQANISLSQTDSAITYAQQALGIAERIKSDRWAVESLVSIAKAYKLNKQFAESLDYYLKALSLAEGLRQTDLLASTYMDLGLLYQDWNVHEQAIEYYKKVLEIRRGQGDKEAERQLLNYIGLAQHQMADYDGALATFQSLSALTKNPGSENMRVGALRNIANIYATRGQHQRALDYNLEILDIKRQLQDSLGVATYLNNIGFIYQKLEQRNKAKQYFKEALDLNRLLGRDEGENVVMLLNIGVIYQYALDYNNALAYFKEALGILERKNDVGQMAKTCNYITTIYLGIQDYENAKLYTQKAIDLAKQAGDLQILANSYQRLSQIYQEQRNNRKALEYYVLYADTKDSIISEERRKQEQFAAKKIEAEKQEKELKLRLSEQEKRALQYQTQQLEAAKKVQELALEQRNKDLLLRDQELELSRLKEEELEKARQFQHLQLEQQRLEASRQQQQLELVEKSRELEKQQRILHEKENQEQRKKIEQLQLAQRVQDLELDNFRRTRLFIFASAGMLLVLMGVMVFGYIQKNKANKKLAAINAEIQKQKSEIEGQRDQIAMQKSEIERSYQDIKLLSVIGQKITASLDVESVSQTVYEYISSLMNTSTVGLGIYNEDSKCLEFRGSIEDGQLLPFHYYELNAPNSLSVWCFNYQKQVVINNFEEDYRQYINLPPRPHTNEAMGSAVYLPLTTENKPIGVITVQSRKNQAYSSKDLTVLQTLASYISIALDNASAYEIIQTKNKHITDSIRYAQTIQKAILPSTQKMNEVLPDHFVLYYPKDIVSGDFFWFLHIPAEKLPATETVRKDKTYIATVDCTGHGVPGAFMSMIGNSLLNDIVTQMQAYEPAEILELLHTSVVTQLRQHENENDDGMDVCLCLIEEEDDDNVRVTYTGAKRPLYYVAAGTGRLRELKGTNKNIGGVAKKYRSFSNETVVLPHGSMLYLSTDGLPDQHNRDNDKIGSLRFKYVLQENHTLSLNEQKEALASLLFKHQNGVPQRDDITVVGVKV